MIRKGTRVVLGGFQPASSMEGFEGLVGEVLARISHPGWEDIVRVKLDRGDVVTTRVTYCKEETS